MLDAMAMMMDEVGCTGLWADGYISGYVRDLYSYDRWDGHSVDIDPESKRVVRCSNLVPHTALPVSRRTIRLITERGGVLITNGRPRSCECPCAWSRHVPSTPESLAMTPRASFLIFTAAVVLFCT